MAGVTSAILSTAAWVANWYLPEIRPGHARWTYVALTTYVLSLIALLLWMTRLKSKQLIPPILFFLFASLLIFIATRLIKANYIELFSLTRELFRGKSIEEYDPRYVMNWGILFLYPFLFMLNGATLLLFLLAFLLWFIKRTKESKALKNVD
jgi:hypothetical protein